MYRSPGGAVPCISRGIRVLRPGEVSAPGCLGDRQSASRRSRQVTSSPRTPDLEGGQEWRVRSSRSLSATGIRRSGMSTMGYRRLLTAGSAGPGCPSPSASSCSSACGTSSASGTCTTHRRWRPRIRRSRTADSRGADQPDRRRLLQRHSAAHDGDGRYPFRPERPAVRGVPGIACRSAVSQSQDSQPRTPDPHDVPARDHLEPARGRVDSVHGQGLAQPRGGLPGPHL